MKKLILLIATGFLIFSGCEKDEDLTNMIPEDVIEQTALSSTEVNSIRANFKFGANGQVTRASFEYVGEEDCSWITTHTGTAEVDKHGLFNVFTEECLTLDEVTGIYTNDGTAVFTSVETGEVLNFEFLLYTRPSEVEDFGIVEGTWVLVDASGPYAGKTGSGYLIGTQDINSNYLVTFDMYTSDTYPAAEKLKAKGELVPNPAGVIPDEACQSNESYIGSVEEKKMKLGVFEVVTQECVTYDPETQIYTTDGTAIFTHTETGDEWYFSFIAQFGPATNTTSPMTGTWIIDGGTGQFTGSIGSGIITGTQYLEENYRVRYGMTGSVLLRE